MRTTTAKDRPRRLGDSEAALMAKLPGTQEKQEP
jgi:hypothetical protein